MTAAISLRPLLVSGLCALVLCSANSPGEGEKPSWPQWRGADGQGLSRETGWSLRGKSLWKTNVGLGYSTVSIADGRLYTMGHNAEWQEDAVYCLDALTGEEIWVHPFPSKTWNLAHKGGTLSTPSVDGKLVFASNREGNLFCLNAVTGEVLWHKMLKDEFDLEYPTWGLSASPFVFPDMVVMSVGPVLAFDKEGALLWKSERNLGHVYATPAAITIDGRSCVAALGGEGVAILDRATGKELAFSVWTLRNQVNAATPVVIGTSVFLSAGYNRGCTLVDFAGGEAKTLWENRVLRTTMSGAVLWEDHLYGFDDAVLKCIDRNGEEKWAQRGLGGGCMFLAGGRILAMSERGELVIAEATPEKYNELSRQQVLLGGVYWTTPVLLDGLIYCRNSEGDLVCLDHRAKPE